MRNLVVKRISLSILCVLVIFCAVILFGCNQSNKNLYEEQGYTAVYKIEYANNDSLTSLTSFYEFSIETEEITEDEYNSLDYDFYDNSHYTMNTKNYSLDETGKIYKYYGNLDDNLGYYIITITSFEARYLYVKILENNKFELIDTDENHNIIYTTYYSIEYFS